MLEALVAAINNDTSTITATVGRQFPKHLTDEVCEFLIVGNGYFDFKGRDGLISLLKHFVPATHYLVVDVKKDTYKIAIQRLTTLRNLAAHESAPARKAAREATGAERLGSAGAWLKIGTRLRRDHRRAEGSCYRDRDGRALLARAARRVSSRRRSSILWLSVRTRRAPCPGRKSEAWQGHRWRQGTAFAGPRPSCLGNSGAGSAPRDQRRELAH